MQSWFLVIVYWESSSISHQLYRDLYWFVLLSRSTSHKGTCQSKSCSWHLWLCWWWLDLHLQRMLPDAATGCWYASMCSIKYIRGLHYYGACKHAWSKNGDAAPYLTWLVLPVHFLRDSCPVDRRLAVMSCSDNLHCIGVGGVSQHELLQLIILYNIIQ